MPPAGKGLGPFAIPLLLGGVMAGGIEGRFAAGIVTAIAG